MFVTLMNTMEKFIINPEQIEAHRQAERDKNPNKERLDEIRKQQVALSTESLSLMTEREKYYNLMLALASFEEYDSAVSFMSNKELCEHMFNLFSEHLKTGLDSAIFDETLKRLGWPFDSENENT